MHFIATIRYKRTLLSNIFVFSGKTDTIISNDVILFFMTYSEICVVER